MWGADLYICAGLLIFKFGDYVNDERCTGPIAMSIFLDGLYSIDSSSVYLRDVVSHLKHCYMTGWIFRYIIPRAAWAVCIYITDVPKFQSKIY